MHQMQLEILLDNLSLVLMIVMLTLKLKISTPPSPVHATPPVIKLEKFHSAVIKLFPLVSSTIQDQ